MGDATGDAIKTCADDSKYCPDQQTLSNMQTMSVWAEGVEGDVHLEIKSVVATGCGDSLSEKPNIVELAQSVDDLSTLSTDLKQYQRVATVEGKHLDVIKTHKGVHVGADLKSLKNVTGADNLASNGVAHIIDGVMLPPSHLSVDKPNIVELAQSVDDLSTLVTAVVAADLAETLTSPGPFTVFAPTNEAFGALPEGTVDSLLKPENKAQLADILTYHVLPEQVLSTDLKFFQSVKTVEGKPLHVFKYGSEVRVGPDLQNLKKVAGADNLASNGVAHIIDGVMLPPADLGA